MIDLDNNEMISSTEASLLWGKQKDYVRTIYNKYPQRFPKGTIKKFGKQIIVTRQGMEKVTGCKKLDLVRLAVTIKNHKKKEIARVIGVSEGKLLLKFQNDETLKVDYNQIEGRRRKNKESRK